MYGWAFSEVLGKTLLHGFPYRKKKNPADIIFSLPWLKRDSKIIQNNFLLGDQRSKWLETECRLLHLVATSQYLLHFVVAGHASLSCPVLLIWPVYRVGSAMIPHLAPCGWTDRCPTHPSTHNTPSGCFLHSVPLRCTNARVPERCAVVTRPLSRWQWQI